MTDLEAMAGRLVAVPGVVGVMLGGSRARGAQREDSDWDLGVYYRGELDLDALAALAAEVTGAPVDIAGLGGWGPWVDGGAWLVVNGVHVDWILRDLDRVLRVWEDCRAGRYEVGHQVGHPLGFYSPAYAGEVALGRILADPGGELAALRERTGRYPEPLRAALVGAGAWEADFSLAIARKPAARGDVLHVALCLSRAIGVLTQALFAHHHTWCLNEKGALAAAAGLPDTPADFRARAEAVLTGLDDPRAAVEAAAALTADVRTVLEGAGGRA